MLVLIVLVSLGVVYLTQPHLPYWAYRCFAGAESKYACLRGRPTLFRTTTLGSVYEGNTADYIDRRVLFFGAFEKAELFFLRDVSAGGVFVDIGAHKGLYSLYLSKYQRQVHAFEPYEPVLKQLRRHVALNSLKNIVIHPVGLGDEETILPFEQPGANNTGLGSFAFVSGERAPGALKIVPGDRALREAGASDVDLIKMDVEGFEKTVLRGLTETLSRSRPIVLFELSIRSGAPSLFQSIEEVVKAFPADYELAVFRGLDEYTGDYQLIGTAGALNFNGNSETHNVVAYPKEKKSRIPLRGPLKMH